MGAVVDDRVRARNLDLLAREFVNAAKLYGQVIVSERDAEHKTVQSARMGGVAGGDKYVAGGILFKFATDVQLPSGEWLYGGKTRNDEAAHKAAGHERKSLNEVLKFAVMSGSRVGAPMITVVDYLGCRLTAQALLPIRRDTLIYGSSDAGNTIKTGESASHFLGDIERLASALHLAPHRVTERATGGAQDCVLAGGH